MADPILVITGATATGKSALALEVARRLDGEIVSMDSRQVYRGMDVGTAKPTVAEQLAVPHHGLDLVDPGERYSAGRFARDARAWIAGIRQRGRVPVLVGGTGFFLRALLQPLFAEPFLDPDRRERLKQWLAGRQVAELVRWVQWLDPAAAEVPLDPQRLARRLEVALLSGRPLSWWHQQADPAAEPLSPLLFVLELPRDELYRRINERVERMVAGGLAAEVQGLLARGYDLHDPGMKTVGYIELVPYVRGERTLPEAIALIQNASRGFARRQLTWFRRQLPAARIALDATLPVPLLAERIITEWRRVEP